MNTIPRFVTVAAVSLLAAICCLSAQAASAATDTAAVDTITFDQYRDWRLHFIEQRQTQIAAELAAKDLTAPRRATLERQ